MTPPGPDRLFAALDATWPAARRFRAGPWALREGQGGGQRVSAATAEDAVTEADIAAAEAGMRALAQRPIFMIRDRDAALDGWLAARIYEIVDPVTLYAVPAETIAAPLKPTTATPAWPPLAIQREIWDAGHVGPARIAVMERAASPKTALIGRAGDAPAGTAFVACDGEIAMLHALEVSPAHRRAGLGRRLMQGAANWALKQGATWLTLAVTRANAPANGLYRALGMAGVAAYHYRRAPESP